MKCSLKCKTPMSSKLGGSCGDACALDADHSGRCKCRLMLRIDAAVRPLYASEKNVDLDTELKDKWKASKKNQRMTVRGATPGALSSDKAAE